MSLSRVFCGLPEVCGLLDDIQKVQNLHSIKKQLLVESKVTVLFSQ